MVAGAFEVDDDDESVFDESLEELDFSVFDVLDVSLELEPSDADDELELLPFELLDASRLSLR